MYLNYERKELLFKAKVQNGETHLSESVFAEKGVAILSSMVGF